MSLCLASADRLNRRVAELTALFTTIAHTRMAGVPVLNTALRVEAIGFECLPPSEGDAAGLGILVTPWFMNLVRLPLHRNDSAAQVGRTHEELLAGQRFAFIGAHEAALGAFGACSLFSPMFEFADQASAHATAVQVLAHLRPSPVPAARTEPAPARRSFLFGRSAVPEVRP
ncbi:MAG: [NiFe]-hydrogenase assembly, chaperone, HybE [Leptothrix sp. (in: Bacteria)]|nr:[NiFe]-hydrogenase assembly, chaperone, HybE [Leptothrix sp. (in: b-proteobacteria)]